MLLLALLTAAADPPPPPTVSLAKPPDRPAPTVVTQARGPVRLTSDVPCEWWSVLPAAELVVFPDRKSAVLIPPGPGRWPVLAWAVRGNVSSRPLEIEVVYGGPPPTPLPPPSPVPPPPTPPADPFAAALRAAYRTDPTQPETKRGQAATLAELYRQAAVIAGRPDTATGFQLIDQVRRAADVLGVSGLIAVRTLVAEEVGKIADLVTPLTADTRAKIADVYNRAAVALTAPE
jgi:hypothetical protein